MFPDVLALPYQAGQWTVLLDQDTVLVRSGRQNGFAIELESAFETIRAALEEAGEERPQRLQVIQCSGDSDVLLEDQDAASDDVAGLPKEAADAVLENLGVSPAPVWEDTISEESDESDETLHDVTPEEEGETSPDDEGIDYILQSTICEPPSQLAALEIEMTSMSYAISPLGLLAQFLEGRNVIDLLQGRYSRREQYGRLWRPWRPAAVLLGVFLILQVSILVGRYVYLSGEVRDLRERVEQIYRDAFPEVKNIVNPRVQMERNLKELATSAQGGEMFLNLMAQVSQPLEQTAGLQVERLAFNDGYLDLALTVGNLQDLDRLKGSLLQQGSLDVEIQSASSSADRVEARVRVGVRGS
jgi:type II secretory pathway component PulL